MTEFQNQQCRKGRNSFLRKVPRFTQGRNYDEQFMNTHDLIDEEVDEPFNGAELSESVLARDWNSPEEEAAWSNL